MTTWRPVPGWEQFYEVSDDGQVRSFDYVKVGGKGSRQLIPAGPVSTWVTPNGYTAVSLYRRGRRRVASVHALVCEAFIGPRPDGHEVRHLDGDPSNNVLANLTYGTPRENALDTIRHGNHRKVAITHCPEGHEYSAGNTLRRKNGHRVCRECNRRRCAEYYERKKAAA